MLSSNRIWKSRLHEIGLIERDLCLYLGLSGIIARSARIILDARLTGYEYYHALDWSIFVASSGDCLDRYLIRMNEMLEANKIVSQSIGLLV